jgi:hypothetical protein
MKFIKGKNRDQIEFFSLNGVVDTNNEVRLIDLFVDSLSLGDYGFKDRFYRKWSSCVSPFGFVETLFVRLFKSNSFLQTVGKRVQTKPGSDVVNEGFDS